MKRDLLESLRQRSAQDWLIGLDPVELSDRAEQRFHSLLQSDAKPFSLRDNRENQAILLAEPEAIDFLAGFIAAAAAECPVFLGNPHLTAAEWQTVLNLVQPDCVWATGRPEGSLSNGSLPIDNQKPQFPAGTIGIPTGGSSGQIRFALHNWDTLTASVAGFCAYFQTDFPDERTASSRVNSCCVLPLFHVSGLMQFLRSFCSGGKFALFASKELERQIGQIDPAEFFISLVPTQLQRLLENPANLDWLTQFQTILLGGAPAWSDLLETARSLQLNLALTYGMTETASQVVALKPKDFLQGRLGCGQALPHARVRICDAQGNPAPAGAIGTVTICADSLCHGYLPASLDSQLEQTQQLVTDDLGYFDAAGYLHLVGRNSQKIITAGENVFPAEVEAAIRQTGFVQDVCVIGLPDRIWGEAVTALIVPAAHLSADLSINALEAALQPKLSRYKQPKKWLALDRIPRNPQGKVNYELLKSVAQDLTRDW